MGTTHTNSPHTNSSSTLTTLAGVAEQQQQQQQHTGLHHRVHVHQQQHASPPAALTEQHSSSSQHPADVEAAISSSGDPPATSKDVDIDAPLPAADDDEEQYATVTYGDIFKQFSILGWTAFGGPAAHIGLFQRVRLLYVCVCVSVCVAERIQRQLSGCVEDKGTGCSSCSHVLT